MLSHLIFIRIQWSRYSVLQTKKLSLKNTVRYTVEVWVQKVWLQTWDSLSLKCSYLNEKTVVFLLFCVFLVVISVFYSLTPCINILVHPHICGIRSFAQLPLANQLWFHQGIRLQLTVKLFNTFECDPQTRHFSIYYKLNIHQRV